MLLADPTAKVIRGATSKWPATARRRGLQGSGAGASTAVIVGGGPAGLLAALALEGRFERRIVIERGQPSCAAEAPALLFAGCMAPLEDLCPGLPAELVAAGAVPFDASGDFRWTQRGRTAGGYRTGIEVLAVSRRLLSQVLRRRLDGQPAVEFHRGSEVVGLDLDDCRDCIRGVFLRPLDSYGARNSGSDETWIGADLVVDAGGHRGQSPEWLRHLGLPMPEERVLGRQIAVTIQVFRWRRPEQAPSAALLVDAPGGSSALYPIEEGRWVAMVGARSGFDSRFDPGLAIEQGALAQSLRHGEALGAARSWRSVRPSRLDFGGGMGRAASGPAGFVALGASLAAFDPLFDPGFSVSVATALALRRHTGEDYRLLRPARWWRRAQPAIRRATRAAAIRDLDPAEGQGQRLLRRALAQAVRRPALGARVFRVWQLVDRPAGLLLPALYGSLLEAARG
ncbi:MAG: FAD-dependent monooxygenase [Acidobacteriota bacterium]